MFLKPLAVPSLLFSAVLLLISPNSYAQTALEVWRDAVVRSWTNSRSNFEGDVRLDKFEIKMPRTETEEEEEDPYLAELTTKKQQAMREIMRSMSAQVSGAWDAEAGKMELITAIRFTKRNVLMEVKVPIIIDGPSTSLFVDASALDLLVPRLAPYQGKFIRISLPESLKEKLPLKQWSQRLPNVITNIYSAIDPKLVSFQPLDQQARALNAKYKLRITLSDQQSMMLFGQAARALLQENDQTIAEDKQQQLLLLEALIAESKQHAQSHTTSDLYLDAQLNILAGQQQILIQNDQINAQVTANFRTSNLGKPVFQYALKQSDIVDLDKLFPNWQEALLTNPNDAAEHELAEEAPITKPKAKSRHPKRKPTRKP